MDLRIRRFPYCCHVFIVSNGCPTNEPKAPTILHRDSFYLPDSVNNNKINANHHTTNTTSYEITVNYHHFYKNDKREEENDQNGLKRTTT